MEIKSIIDWFKRPIPGWTIVFTGAIVMASGVYDLISAFYVKHLHEYQTPIVLQATFAILVTGFGAICIYLGSKSDNGRT